MKKIIPFEKEIVFKTNISEITSIALENTLSIANTLVSGEFIVSGDYKVSDASLTVEPFNQILPVEIHIDDKYMTTKAIVDIDDFYYEVINNQVLKVCIDVSIDRLEEKESIDMDRNIKDDIKEKIEEITEDVIEVKDKVVEKIDDVKEYIDETKENVKDKINSLFSNLGSNDTYISYNIYIIRDGDTIETILDKYDATEDSLRLYNDLSDLKIGDKIVIPN